MRLRRARPNDSALADALRAVRDELRGGRSLREALVAASDPATPFAAMADELRSGRPLGDVLREFAPNASTDVACALVVLAVQAEVGGDPGPAVRALEDRIRRRVVIAQEARAMTTQARMSARAVVMLTPGFLLLLFALDPRGTISSLASPATRAALGAGVVLQILGSLWASRIVKAATPTEAESRLARVPVIRALTAMTTGRVDTSRATASSVGDTAEVLALVLRAGLSPVRGLEIVSPAARGAFGDAVREAVASVRAGTGTADSLRACVSPLGAEAARFVRVFVDADRLGTPLADSLRTFADDVRDASAIKGAEDVRRASVRVLLPLGLLILPAFVLACLVPLLVGGLQGISL